MGAHAKLAPSAAERWINCPRSVRLSEGFTDTQSPYAAEGTLAHRLAELKLREKVTGDAPDPADFEAVRRDPLYAPEMERHTDDYVGRVLEGTAGMRDPLIMPETRVSLAAYGRDDIFGTADCLALAGDELRVFDFKYGKNVMVDAEWNPQMLLYAAGAVGMYSMFFDIERVTMAIVQPRMDNYSEFAATAAELEGWLRATALPAAAEAMGDAGDANPGEWCRFCLAKPVCRARGAAYGNPPEATPPDLLSDSEVAERLARLEGMDSYLKELREYALGRILEGGSIPGYKAVEGRSVRAWRDSGAAMEAAGAALGLAPADLYESKPVSVTKLEKLVGKKRFRESMGAYVVKPQGKPTLVRETDSRAPFERRTDPGDDFADIQIGFELEN